MSLKHSLFTSPRRGEVKQPGEARHSNPIVKLDPPDWTLQGDLPRIVRTQGRSS
jgi:hypothetical protein